MRSTVLSVSFLAGLWSSLPAHACVVSEEVLTRINSLVKIEQCELWDRTLAAAPDGNIMIIPENAEKLWPYATCLQSRVDAIWELEKSWCNNPNISAYRDFLKGRVMLIESGIDPEKSMTDVSMTEDD